MDNKRRSTNTYTRTRIYTSTNISTTIYTHTTTPDLKPAHKKHKTAKIASSSNNNSNNNSERPHHNEVTDLTNIPTSPENEDTVSIDTENPYTQRRERPDRREFLRARRRSSLSFPTQESTLVSYGSTDIESNIIRPIETINSEPPSRTGTPTLHNFSISSPSEHSSVNRDHTPTPSEFTSKPFPTPNVSTKTRF